MDIAYMNDKKLEKRFQNYTTKRLYAVIMYLEERALRTAKKIGRFALLDVETALTLQTLDYVYKLKQKVTA